MWGSIRPTAHRPAEPALLYYGDFGGKGDRQLVEACYEAGRVYPWRNRRDLGAVIPSVLKRYPRTTTYARATLGEILGEERLAAAQRFEATEFRSGVFLGQADGTYRFSPLPRIAQIAPCRASSRATLTATATPTSTPSRIHIRPSPYVGRFDGGLSQLLRGEAAEGFTAVPAGESGLVVPGDAKALAVADLDQDGWPIFSFRGNNAPTLAFRNKRRRGPTFAACRLRGPKGNPSAVGARVTLGMADGSSQIAEIYAGSGYYSQSLAACFFGWKRGPGTQESRCPLRGRLSGGGPRGSRRHLRGHVRSDGAESQRPGAASVRIWRRRTTRIVPRAKTPEPIRAHVEGSGDRVRNRASGHSRFP